MTRTSARLKYHPERNGIKPPPRHDLIRPQNTIAHHSATVEEGSSTAEVGTQSKN